MRWGYVGCEWVWPKIEHQWTLTDPHRTETVYEGMPPSGRLPVRQLLEEPTKVSAEPRRGGAGTGPYSGLLRGLHGEELTASGKYEKNNNSDSFFFPSIKYFG